MKWYFLHTPGQEEQFKLYFTHLPKVFKNFVPPPPQLLGTWEYGVVRREGTLVAGEA